MDEIGVVVTIDRAVTAAFYRTHQESAEMVLKLKDDNINITLATAKSMVLFALTEYKDIELTMNCIST